MILLLNETPITIYQFNTKKALNQIQKKRALIQEPDLEIEDGPHLKEIEKR
jgi:hypothetical protein